jgi:hypothetical protein
MTNGQIGEQIVTKDGDELRFLTSGCRLRSGSPRKKQKRIFTESELGETDNDDDDLDGITCKRHCPFGLAGDDTEMLYNAPSRGSSPCSRANSTDSKEALHQIEGSN